MRIVALAPLLFFISSGAYAEHNSGGLYPPGLLPLINRANALLSTGHFNEAVKIYTEAIEQSPADYLLHYKRATANFSLQRHAAALDDFDKVLSITGNSFDNAFLMKARIHLREGQFSDARSALATYRKGKGKTDNDSVELEREITQGEDMKTKAQKERRAQLWNACIESASQSLKVASHSAEIRTWRAECSLAAGDIESAVGDLTRLTHILPPSTTLLTHVFRLSYFLLSPSPAPLNTLKQCLHYDPDSKICLTLHRMLKAFDRSFNKMDDLVAKEDWHGVVKHLLGSKSGKNGELWLKWEEALHEHMGEKENLFPLVPPALYTHNDESNKSPFIPLPDAAHISPPRQTLIRTLCKAYTHLADASTSASSYKTHMSTWCEQLLTLSGCSEDVDGLIGKGESLLEREEWEEAVRVLEKAFELSGRNDRAILQRLQKAQRGLKVSRQKDYYKILGVARDADAKTIKKAFRTAAKKAHPDKGGSEAKMAALNEAYEVLSNPELRARVDAAEDPMDPRAQQGGNPFAHHGFSGGGHPFTQFFQQQGGSFQFHFPGN